MIEFMIFVGGGLAIVDEYGMLKAMFWPYYLGRAAARWAMKECR